MVAFVMTPLICVGVMSFSPSRFLTFPFKKNPSMKWFNEVFSSMAIQEAVILSLLIGIEKQPCCAKDGKTDLKRTGKFLCCLFPVGCLIGIGVIILYFKMYFSFDLSFNIIFGISCK